MSRQSPRSCLSVPGSSERMLNKALTTGADEIVIDLEDAVAVDAKEDARIRVVDFLEIVPPEQRIAVRVNAVGTPWCHHDLIALASHHKPPSSVVLPKVESAGDVAFAERLVAGVSGEVPGTGIRIQALIESVVGLTAIHDIARSSRSLEALIIGYADLGASLGRAPKTPWWSPAREQVLWAARANALRAVDGPHLGIAVDADFTESLDVAASSGFDAKWVIHPAQIAAVNEALSPSKEDIVWADKVLAALATAASEGAGAVALDGSMIDEAVAVNARRILARAGDR